MSSPGTWLPVSLSCLETWAWGPVRPQGHGAGRQGSEALGPEAPHGLTVLPLAWGTCSLDPHPDGEAHCPAPSTKLGELPSGELLARMKPSPANPGSQKQEGVTVNVTPLVARVMSPKRQAPCAHPGRGAPRLHTQQAPTPEGSVHAAGVRVGHGGSQELGAAPTRGPRRRAGAIALCFPTPSKSKSRLLHVAHEVAPEPASHPP